MREFPLECWVFSDSEPFLFGFLKTLNLKCFGDRRKLFALIEMAAALSADDLRQYVALKSNAATGDKNKQSRRLQLRIKGGEGQKACEAIFSYGMDALRPAEFVYRLEVAASQILRPVAAVALPSTSEISGGSSTPLPPQESAPPVKVAPPVKGPESLTGIIGSVSSLASSDEIPFEAMAEYFQ